MALVNSYTTLAILKARISVADTADDTEIERIITAVSRAIDGFCGRRFYAATQTRTYTASRSDRLMVSDLVSVTALTTDGDGDGVYETTWAATDYRLRPSNAAADGKPYWEIRTSPIGRYSFPCGVEDGVRIAGSHGYPAASPDLAIVEDACLAQCKIEYEARNANETMEGGGNPSMRISLHPFAKNLLSEAGLRLMSVA